MKKLIYLLICLFLQPSNLCAQSKAPSSFEDFLKQMKSQTESKQTETEMPSEEIVSKEIEDAEAPFFSDFSKQLETGKLQADKAERLEREIVYTLEHQITPLANDLFKIVESPEAKKTLEEKKKQNEQKQKAAEKRLEELKRQRGSSHYPSYRSSGSRDKDWSPYSSSRGGRGDGYSSSYSPSDWDHKYKGKNWWDTDDKDKDKGLKNKDLTKETEDKEKEKGGSTIDKDVKKALTEAENLTDQICDTISRNMSESAETLAISPEIFAYLSDSFEKRQNALRLIRPEENKDQDLASRTGRRSAVRRGAPKSKISTKTALGPELTKKIETENDLWKKFLPKILHARIHTELIDDTDEMKKAQNTAHELLGKLKNHGKISEQDIRKITSEIEKKLSSNLEKLDKPVDENSPVVKRIYREADKIPGGPINQVLKMGAQKSKEEGKAKEKEQDKEKEQIDPSLKRINKYTKDIKQIISQTSGLKPDSKDQKEIENNQKIYTKIIAYELFTQLLQLIDLREKELMEKDNPEEILKSDTDWKSFIPTLLQAITDTGPDLDKEKEKLDEQAQGKRLLSKLRSLEYITEEQMNEAQEKFENDLAAKIEAAKPGGQAEDEDELKRLQTQAKKLPGINTEKLGSVIKNINKQAGAKKTGEDYVTDYVI